MTPHNIRSLFPNIDPNSISTLSVFNQFHEGTVIADCDGKILYYNEAQACIDDLSVDDVLGKIVTDVYRVDDDDTPIIKCVQTGRAVKNFACYYRTRLGKIVNSIHNVYPLHSYEKMIGVVCFVRDYSTTQQTFDDVSTPNRSKEVRTFGIPVKPHQTKDFGNGTRFSFKDIIGQSPEFEAAVSSARTVADSPSSIMIYGETGTGKELIAQSIHNQSSRNSGQFVAINCAAIPEHLLEGILFGTARGAFTGALDKQGLFEQADGGTLFLDEINSMSMGLQAKLLRVIQERKVRRVGSLKEIYINIRIISSVNEDPHQAANRGALRYDLLYRLGVLIVRIPPLRERMGDLEKLISHFLNKSNIMLDKKVNAISANVMDLLHNYHWPGNVRELEHVIEGAVNLVGDTYVIKVQHLPAHIHQTRVRAYNGDASSDLPWDAVKGLEEQLNVVFPAGTQSVAGAPSPTDTSLAKIQAENESRTIIAALSFFQGNVSRAAKKLELSPQLLHYKMKKHGINRKNYLR